jgi:hypothetical protein
LHQRAAEKKMYRHLRQNNDAIRADKTKYLRACWMHREGWFLQIGYQFDTILKHFNPNFKADYKTKNQKFLVQETPFWEFHKKFLKGPSFDSGESSSTKRILWEKDALKGKKKDSKRVRKSSFRDNRSTGMDHPVYR